MLHVAALGRFLKRVEPCRVSRGIPGLEVCSRLNQDFDKVQERAIARHLQRCAGIPPNCHRVGTGRQKPQGTIHLERNLIYWQIINHPAQGTEGNRGAYRPEPTRSEVG